MAAAFDQDKLNTTLVARSRGFDERAWGCLVVPQLFFKRDVSFEKCLLVFERVIDVSGWYVEEFVFQQIEASRKLLAKLRKSMTL